MTQLRTRLTAAPAPRLGGSPVARAKPAVTQRRRLAKLVAIVGVLVIGIFAPTAVLDPYNLTVLLNGVFLGLMAMSVGFLYREIGWVSFGAAAFSGAGGYLFGILAMTVKLPTMPAALLGALGAGVLAVLVGLVFVRSRALVFTMLTLALGQLLLEVVSLNGLLGVTGGSNGLVVQFSGTFAGLTQAQANDPAALWPVVWTVAVVLLLLVYAVGKSRFGAILRGVRENEMRLEHSGFNTYLPKLAAFAFAGLVGGVAGVLQTVNLGFVSPSQLGFAASGSAIVAALIGGYRSPAGALIGGIVLTWGQSKFGASGELYLYTGMALVVVLVAFPTGIMGMLTAGCHRLFSRIRRPRNERSAHVGD